MRETYRLATVSDDALLHRLAELLRDSRRTEADLVAHIGEVDKRRLYARERSPSMFAYCTLVLHLSESEAYLRIAAARAARKHPVLLDMLADGRLHLSGIAKLKPHLTDENRDAILSRALHRSKRQIEELIADISPRPDVPTRIRKLPDCTPSDQADAPPRAAEGTQRVDSLRRQEEAAAPRLGPDAVCSTSAVLPHATQTQLSRPAPPPVVEVLAPSRYKVQFTASEELRGKLERLQALLRSEIPDGNLATVIDRAVSESLQRLEARRYAKRGAANARATADQATTGVDGAPAGALPDVRHEPDVRREPDVRHERDVQGEPDGQRARVRTQPRTQAEPGAPREQRCTQPLLSDHERSRHIPAPIRRAVYARDQGRCCYSDKTGRRCPERYSLEYHHRLPFGRGGDHSLGNTSLMCRAHNLHLAELDYGGQLIAGYRRAT